MREGQTATIVTFTGISEQNSHTDVLLAGSILGAIILILFLVCVLIGFLKWKKWLDKPSSSTDPTEY